jgi:hypothetical protein
VTAFDARGGIVVRAMKKRSPRVSRGLLQLASNAGPVRAGAVPPLSVAPWQAAHDCWYSASPLAACASVKRAGEGGTRRGRRRLRRAEQRRRDGRGGEGHGWNHETPG